MRLARIMVLLATTMLCASVALAVSNANAETLHHELESEVAGANAKNPTTTSAKPAAKPLTRVPASATTAKPVAGNSTAAPRVGADAIEMPEAKIQSEFERMLKLNNLFLVESDKTRRMAIFRDNIRTMEFLNTRRPAGQKLSPTMFFVSKRGDWDKQYLHVYDDTKDSLSASRKSKPADADATIRLRGTFLESGADTGADTEATGHSDADADAELSVDSETELSTNSTFFGSDANLGKLSAAKLTALEATLPASLDYRDSSIDYLGPVYNTYACGAAWATTAASTASSAIAVQTKTKVVPLSPLTLLECTFWGAGCGGGWKNRGFITLFDEGAVQTNAFHPFNNEPGSEKFYLTKCILQQDKYNREKYSLPKLKYKHVRVSGTETQIKYALNKYGPIAVNMIGNGLFNYSPGSPLLDNGDDCSRIKAFSNYAAVVVGYGQSAALGKYWIMRNSMGDQFGESAGKHYPGKKGYFYMQRTPFSCNMFTSAMAVVPN